MHSSHGSRTATLFPFRHRYARTDGFIVERPGRSIQAATIALALALLGAWPVSAGQTLHKVMVPMRDGTRLAADVYLPDGDGPFPVVIARSVYGRGNEGMARPFMSQGMAFMPQDTRGRGDSEGVDRVFADDGWDLMQDGYDTVAWAKCQPWCNGKVATWGGSALGITQVRMAAAGTPVDFQGIVVAASGFYGGLSYQGGVWRRALCEPWLTNQGRKNVIGLWKSHPYLDTFWKSMDAGPRAPYVHAPALHVGGWWDIFQQGTIDNFVSRQEHGGAGVRGTQKLIIGPWTHATNHGPRKSGDLQLPANYSFDVEALQRRLLQHYLLGEENGADNEPAVHYYTLGDVDQPSGPGNQWRTAACWPPFETEETLFYLDPAAALVRDMPTDPRDRVGFTYDPNDPCPTRGGANLALPAGPFDQREISLRKDVLRFVTEPLDEPLEVTGRVKVRLYVSSDAPDTDFTAKLVDVYPDGREILLLDSIQRVKLRKDFEAPSLLAPGEVAKLEIDLWSISVVFAPGHRIGLHISSSNYPRFEKNPNTGDDFPQDGKLAVAHNVIHLGTQYPSALLLPVHK